MMETIIQSVVHSLEKNGFPEKKVTLPFKPVFDACKKKDVKLADVLRQLETQEILSDIGNEKILFYTKEHMLNDAQNAAAGDDMDKGMFARAMDQLKSMDPAKLKEMKDKVMAMSPEERADLLEKAKDMFKK